MPIRSYTKILNLGHAHLENLFSDPVNIEEKIDGSMIAFGMIQGDLCIRSKGKQLILGAVDKLFIEASQYIESIAHLLEPNYTYWGECLKKPRHNCLSYNRIPNNHIIIYDIDCAEQSFLGYTDKKEEATRLGFETVPLLFSGSVSGYAHFKEFLQLESILGGPTIEGVVVKNYYRLNVDGKTLMGKFVSEAFKETQKKVWKTDNPNQSDILQILAETYKSPMRWQKGVMHLMEKGELTGSPKDIGPLIQEIKKDILEECELEIKEELFKWAKEKVLRASVGGVAEWYKEQLLKEQFNSSEALIPH